MPDSKERDIQLEVNARIGVATEIYSTCIDKAKEVLKQAFKPVSTFHDGEKKNILQFAHDLFSKVVSAEDIQVMAGTVPNIIVQNINVEEENEPSIQDGSLQTTDPNISGF